MEVYEYVTMCVSVCAWEGEREIKIENPFVVLIVKPMFIPFNKKGLFVFNSSTTIVLSNTWFNLKDM